MPTYQYACTACDERLEAVQSFSDAPLTQCPACGGALRKVFSAVGVVFKGSGFYKNDSRSTKGKSADAGSNGDGDKAAASTSSDSGSTTSTSSPAPAGASSAAAPAAPATTAPASKSA